MTGQLLQVSRRRFGHGARDRAFEAIYDRHHAALFGFCRHMLGSREEAEDALQQVFVSAYRELCSGREPEHLRAWLYAIARNRCVSMLRARRETPCAEPVELAADLAVPGEAEQREDLEELLADMARLPDDQRAALVLAELGDLSHDEIGTALGVRRDKVKALIFQAREALGGWRAARSASCLEIQEQLATLRGSALRRAPLRRHVAVCPRCAAFEHEVARQRAALALLVPVAPGLAVKSAVLAETVGGTVVGGAAVATGGGASAKALVAAALALSAGGAGTVAVRQIDPPRAPAHAAQHAPAERPAVTPARPAPLPRAGRTAPVRHRVKARHHATIARPKRHATHAAAPAPAKRVVPVSPGRSGTAPGRTEAALQPSTHDNGQHGRPAIPPGRAKAGNPAPANRPASVPAPHTAPAERRAATPPAAPVVPALPEAAAPIQGKSAGAPGHNKD